MSSAPEYAFVAATPFIGTRHSTSCASILATARTLAPTFALNELGYDARAYSTAGAIDLATDLAGVKAAVCADASLTGLPGRVFYDLAEVPAALDRDAAFTAASEPVAQALAERLGRPVPVMPEPFHGTREAPRAPQPRRRSRAMEWLARRAGVDTDGWRLRLFWSGEEAEVDALLETYPGLVRLSGSLPLFLHCVAPSGRALGKLGQSLREEDPGALKLHVEPWSPFAEVQARAACDLVLLPDQSPASRSRLIGAVHAGRMGIARASPYHGRLAAFAWVGDELAEGVRWATGHPAEVLERLAAGQRYLDDVHAPATVARAWLQLFMKNS